MATSTLTQLLNYGTLLAQHTSFNTLDNWGHKTPTQSKKRKDYRKEKVKWSWPWTHTVHSVTDVRMLDFHLEEEAAKEDRHSDYSKKALF